MKSEVRERLGLPPLVARFRFGNTGQHEFKLDCSWLGRERYFVNDKLHHSRFSVMPGGTRQFQVHGHSIEIRINPYTRKMDAKAFVDGVLVNDDVFAEANRALAARRERAKESRRSSFDWRGFALQTTAWVVLAVVLAYLLR